MITSSPKTNYQYLRKLLVLPVAVVITALFAFKYKTKVEPGFKHPSFVKTITVVVDAGHGGKTGSLASDGTYEDDISLAIAKKVKELNANDKIKIVLTRETSDAMDLRQRSETGNKQNPDLFISIHCAAAEKNENTASGAEVYISRKNTKWETQNKTLGNILLNNFATIYAVNNKVVQQREVGIWVLDNSNCPAALLECGYMTNAKDVAFVKDRANQEKIANSILQSIEKYAAYKETSGTAQKTESSPESIAASVSPDDTPIAAEGSTTRKTNIDNDQRLQQTPVENKAAIKKSMHGSYPDETIGLPAEKTKESTLIPEENAETAKESQSNNSSGEIQGPGDEFLTADAIEKRKQEILGIKALAKGSHDVAYIFKGRTYLFANSEATNFAEMDGDQHPLMLNGQLISSIHEMNRLVNRDDVKEVGLITMEDAVRLYNIHDYIATVTTR